MPRPARALLLMLLVLTPLLALPAGAGRPAATQPVGPGDIYLALGDSLPAGYEVVNDGQPGFPSIVHAALRAQQPDIALVNMGQGSGTGVDGGETSTSFLAPDGQLAKALAFIQEQRAAGKVISPVTLSIGGNDAVGVILPGSSFTVDQVLEIYRNNLGLILDQLLAALTEDGVRTGDLIIQNYYNPYPGIASDPSCALFLGENDPDRDLPRFNQVIAEVAASRDVPVANVYARFLGNEAEYVYARQDLANRCAQPFDQLRTILDFHPRPAGHRAIAAAFLDAGGYIEKVYLPAIAR